MAESFDYTLFLLHAEKNRREQEKIRKAIEKLTDEELELLIKQKEKEG